MIFPIYFSPVLCPAALDWILWITNKRLSEWMLYVSETCDFTPFIITKWWQLVPSGGTCHDSLLSIMQFLLSFTLSTTTLFFRLFPMPFSVSAFGRRKRLRRIWKVKSAARPSWICWKFRFIMFFGSSSDVVVVASRWQQSRDMTWTWVTLFIYFRCRRSLSVQWNVLEGEIWYVFSLHSPVKLNYLPISIPMAWRGGIVHGPVTVHDAYECVWSCSGFLIPKKRFSIRMSCRQHVAHLIGWHWHHRVRVECFDQHRKSNGGENWHCRRWHKFSFFSPSFCLFRIAPDSDKAGDDLCEQAVKEFVLFFIRKCRRSWQIFSLFFPPLGRSVTSSLSSGWEKRAGDPKRQQSQMRNEKTWLSLSLTPPRKISRL